MCPEGLFGRDFRRQFFACNMEAFAHSPPAFDREMALAPRTPRSFHIDRRANSLAAAVGGNDDDELLTPKQVAGLIGYSEVWLAKRRTDQTGPPHTHINQRSVHYFRSGLRPWLEKRDAAARRAAERAAERRARRRRERAEILA
jgi:predicted DNA-binding transcriptional regulator AlpA